MASEARAAKLARVRRVKTWRFYFLAGTPCPEAYYWSLSRGYRRAWNRPRIGRIRFGGLR